MHKFEELNVWKLAIGLAKEGYFIIASNLPKEEKYGLSDQLKRSAMSIAPNIAEKAGRNNEKEFIHFIEISNGSCCELTTQVILTKELQLIYDTNTEETIVKIKSVHNMLYKLKQSLKNSLNQPLNLSY